MPSPLISVITPTYNRSHFLPDAIDSIQKQNYPNLEIIIVDDGSTDNTKEVVQNFARNIKYIYQENKGPAAARNAGIKEAKGKIIGFLDSDDLWAKDKINFQLQKLLNDRRLDFVMGYCKFVMTDNAPKEKIKFRSNEDSLPNTCIGSGLYRKRVFDKVGLFDETLLFAEDKDWFFRARELNCEISILKKTALIYRIHSDNMTHNKVLEKKYFPKAIKKSIDRRKELGLKGRKLPNWSDYEKSK